MEELTSRMLDKQQTLSTCFRECFTWFKPEQQEGAPIREIGTSRGTTSGWLPLAKSTSAQTGIPLNSVRKVAHSAVAQLEHNMCALLLHLLAGVTQGVVAIIALPRLIANRAAHTNNKEFHSHRRQSHHLGMLSRRYFHHIDACSRIDWYIHHLHCSGAAATCW